MLIITSLGLPGSSLNSWCTWLYCYIMFSSLHCMELLRRYFISSMSSLSCRPPSICSSCSYSYSNANLFTISASLANYSFSYQQTSSFLGEGFAPFFFLLFFSFLSFLLFVLVLSFMLSDDSIDLTICTFDLPPAPFPLLYLRCDPDVLSTVLPLF